MTTNTTAAAIKRTTALLDRATTDRDAALQSGNEALAASISRAVRHHTETLAALRSDHA